MNDRNFFSTGLAGLMDLVRKAAAGKLVKMQGMPGLSPRWLGQHTNPDANARRKAKKAVGGFRQFKKGQREARAAL